MFTVRQPENGFICLIHNIHNANTHNKRKHHEITIEQILIPTTQRTLGSEKP